MLSAPRLSSLLLPALLGVAGVAMAGPQDAGERPRAQPPEAQDIRTPDIRSLREQTRPQRPLRVTDGIDRRERQRRQEDGLSDSVRRIERRTRGQVLSAERVPYEGRDLNRIKVIDENGRVRVFMDDPAQRLPTRGDDD